MEGDGQNLIRIVEGVLDTIPMVGVNVHIGDPKPLIDQVADCHDGVVDIAKAGGPIGCGVVETSGDIESARNLPGGQEAGCLKRRRP